MKPLTFDWNHMKDRSKRLTIHSSRWTKHTLSIFNESMYSDGHCYASGYTDLKIGKTVGMPVPGTCSYAGWEGLPNGAYCVVPVSAKYVW